MARKKSVPAKPRAAVIYARYSSTAQNDASIEQQVEAAEKYANQRGMTVLRVYADRAVSGKSANRPQFQKMLRDAERGEFDVVIAWKSNRIGRNMLQAMQSEYRLEEAGVRCEYVEENFGDTAAGRFALRNMMNVNQFYSENMAEDIARGMMDCARQCKAVGSVPYGYSIDLEKHYVINEDQAPIVREIFARVAADQTYAEIAEDLNRRQIPTKTGGKWVKNSFHSLIHNEKYTGVYLYSDVRIEGGIPRIVDEDLFRQVNEKLKGMKQVRGRHRANNDYILTGKLFCGECLAPMVGCSGTSKGGSPYYYYACQTKRTTRKCDKTNVRKDWIEETVTKSIIQYVLTPDVTEWIVTMMEEYEKQLQDQTELKAHENQLADVKRSIKNLLHAIEMGIITESTKDRLQELESDRAALETQIDIERRASTKPITREQFQFWIEDYCEGDTTDKDFQSKIIKNFVRAVYLYDDHFKVTFDFTHNNLPVSQQFEAKDLPSTASTCSYNASNGVPSEEQANTKARIDMIGNVFVFSFYFK